MAKVKRLAIVAVVLIIAAGAIGYQYYQYSSRQSLFSGEASQGPTVSITICIFDFDSANQQITFNVTAEAFQVNLTYNVITGQINGPFNVRPFIMSPVSGSQGTFDGSTPTLIWPISGRTQDYPFDSYDNTFTFGINSYSLPGGGSGRAVDINSASVGFCGSKANSLENIWLVNTSYLPVTVGGETSRGVQVTLQRNSVLGGLLMTPIWMAALFLGTSFILDPKELNSRLTIFLSIFVFTPAYLFSILILAPAGSILNPPEMQLTFLTIAVAISALITIVSTHIDTARTKAVLEVSSVVGLQLFFILILFLLGQLFSNTINAISLTPFTLVGVVGICYRARPLLRKHK